MGPGDHADPGSQSQSPVVTSSAVGNVGRRACSAGLHWGMTGQIWNTKRSHIHVNLIITISLETWKQTVISETELY